MIYLYNIFDNALKLKFVLTNYALLLLNTPIKIEPQQFLPMWTNANYRVCVDECTVNLMHYTQFHNITMHPDVVPQLITGDFRSIPPQLLEKYEHEGSDIVKTPSTELTDFTKSLHEIAKRKNKIESVVALVEPTGRLDHTFANLNTMSLGKEIFGHHVDIYLLGKHSISWLIQPGKSQIVVPHWAMKYSCAILPFAPRANNVTTTGLKWNLNNQAIEFGGLLSTSNKFSDPVVEITTDAPLIWSMTIRKENLDPAHFNHCQQDRPEHHQHGVN